jgi:6-phosphogluconolactonase
MAVSAGPRTLHVGTYARAGGEGLYALRRADNGLWELGEAYAGARNASFGVYSKRFDLHFLVDEQAAGAIGIFRHDGSGWRQLAHIPSYGAAPCYLALDAAETCLAAANYESGSIALFRLDTDTGIPNDPPVIRAHDGRGPVPDRQEKSHAHCVRFSPDQQWLYHVDLGTDQIRAYAFDSAHDILGEGTTAWSAPPGSGPRHLLFHPHRPLALLVSELASTLTVLQVADGNLATRQVVSTLPQGYGGESLGGHLAVNQAGNRVYVTNRGHDSLAVFALDAAGLTLLQHVPSGGASPRFFRLIEPERLLVLANEEGGTLSFFGVAEDGTLAPRNEGVSVPGPAFVIVEQRESA